MTAHIREITDNVLAMTPTLRQDGTKVAVILATDGLPTDHRGIADKNTQREFVNALRALEGLPVWVSCSIGWMDSYQVAL